MKARLAFAVSVNIDPDILIVDEVLAVGDELFRRKSFAKIEEFFKAGKTILFVSHSVQNVNQLCSRAVMIHNGKKVLDGPSKVVTMHYQKFIFSKPEQKVKILEEFREMTPKMLAEQVIDEKKDVKEIVPVIEIEPVVETFRAYKVNNFIPKSTVITRNAEIDISKHRIETPGGKDVNHLVKGEAYFIKYRIECGEHIGRISLGMSIKTEQGVAVTWRFFPDCNALLPKDYQKGDHLDVQWHFTCHLIPDVYYIGMAIRREADGGSEIAFRGSDIMVFRVLGEKNFDRGGIYDPDFEIKVC
jgi:lipopolysaccharide transport system ATP-binding protein